LDLVLEARKLHLNAPILEHRHLTDAAGRDLTKAAIDDIITRGDIKAWRALVAAMQSDKTGGVGRRVAGMTRALAKLDPKARAFANLLPKLTASPARRSG
jgi:hypothetical protein